ncbi:MAG: exodeoxyribonuclease-3 [Chlamydiales bacterium]|jgi:exodeoxyribonuclease-3
MQSIITWNVNGIRAIQNKGFLEWLNEEDPDILCIQETKAHPDQLTEAVLAPAKYKSYWVSAQKKGYSGCATFTKEEPIKTEVLGIEEFDSEGRVQVLYFPKFVLINAYFPNSQEKGKRVNYKVAFCEALLTFCDKLQSEGHNIVLCGDYNIAHKRIDLKNPDTNEDNPGFLPQERSWMDKFVAAGYVDAFRMFNQEGDNYTWWSYRTRARERNAGWRIDYHCVNGPFKDQVENCTILDSITGSDHCPVKLQLSNNTGAK